LTISSPVALISAPSSVYSKHLQTSPVVTTTTARETQTRSVYVMDSLPAVIQRDRVHEDHDKVHKRVSPSNLLSPQHRHLPGYPCLVSAADTPPVYVTGSSPAVIQHEPVLPAVMNSVDEPRQPLDSPKQRRLPQYPRPMSDYFHSSPTYKSAPQQSMFASNGDSGPTSQATDKGPSANQGTSSSKLVPAYSAPAARHPRSEEQCITPPFVGNRERQLPTVDYSPQRQHVLRYSQPVSASPTYASAPFQQPAYSPHSQTSVMDSSPRQITFGTNNEPAYSRVQPHVFPVKPFLPTAAEQYMYGRPSPSHKPVPPAPVVNHRNSQPADRANYDRYRQHDPTLVYLGFDSNYHGFDPYQQPAVTPPRHIVSTSDVDGVQHHQQQHQQQRDVVGRSSSWRAQLPPPARGTNYEAAYGNSPPAATPTHRSSSQRETFSVGSKPVQYRDRLLASGNGPLGGARLQNMLMNDPYRRHGPIDDGANCLQRDRFRTELPVLSREHDNLYPKNSPRTENVNEDRATVGIPASQPRLSPAPAASRGPSSQYSVPVAVHGRPNTDLFRRYPSPTQNKQSLDPRLLSPGERQRDEFRSPGTDEASPYSIRSRQVCIEDF